MVSSRAHNADVDAVALIPSCEAIDDIDAIAGVEVVDGTFTVDFPDLQIASASVRCACEPEAE